MDLVHLPVWVAAVLGAGGPQAALSTALACKWEYDKGCLHYRATAAVVVDPFGIELRAGDELYVFWIAGETGYRCEVRRNSVMSSLAPEAVELTTGPALRELLPSDAMLARGNWTLAGRHSARQSART